MDNSRCSSLNISRSRVMLDVAPGASVLESFGTEIRASVMEKYVFVCYQKLLFIRP